nr:AAA family ATPase [Actinophytocola xanthii]
MASFRPEQAEWFFGRDQLITELVARLDQRLQGDGGPLIVVAPSGAGKSSLLQAGLLHRVEQGRLPGSRQWPRLVLTPTEHPVSAITTAIAAGVGLDGADTITVQVAAADPATYVEALRQRLRSVRSAESDGASWRLMLVVDQLEELFTMCTDKDERERFLALVDQLTASGTDGQEPLALVVYGLRADFYAQCADHPHLKAVLQDGQVLVGPMSTGELREAIINPARRAGLRIEPGLVDLLLRDLGVGTGNTEGYEAGRLPLLAHALRATWRELHGDTLTVDGYIATGGIEHAVATSADDVYSTLSPPDQETTRALFLRLVKVGDNFDDVRRRVLRSDLQGGSESDQQSVNRVLDEFTSARLLTQQQETVEITHEVLLRAWPRLRDWINEDRTGLQVQQELIEASDRWQRRHRDRGVLYRGAQLVVARDWATRHHGSLDRLAHEFLDTSIRTSRWRLRRLALALVSIFALMASLLIAVTYGYQQRGDALSQQRIAIARGLVGQADAVRETSPTQALRLGLAAHYLDPRSGADASLVTSLTTSSNAGSISNKAEAAVISRDGKTMASVGTDGDDSATKLWDITDPRRPRLGATIPDSLGPMAFSPDGLLVTQSSMDDSLVIWDTRDLSHPREMGRVRDVSSVSSVAFNHDGRALVLTSTFQEGEESELWNISNLAHPRPTWRISQRSGGADFSPRNDILLTTDDDGVTLWDTSDPRSPRKMSHFLETKDISVFATTFSPDGRTLAIATAYGNKHIAVDFWDIAEPRRPCKLGRTAAIHTNTVEAMTFSPDGRTLASGDITGAVTLWDTFDPAHPTKIGQPQTGYTSPVTLVAFVSPGLLATSVEGGGVTLWDTATQARQIDRLKAATISGDLRVIATVDHGKPTLWERTDPLRPKRRGQVDGHANFILRLSYAGDRLVMDSSANSEAIDPLEIWQMADSVRPKILGQLDDFSYGRQMAWSRDGRVLATTVTDAETEVVLWDVSDRPRKLDRLVTDHLPLDGISALALSPDGRTLATGTGSGPPGHSQPEDPTIILWDIRDPSRARELSRIPFSAVDSLGALEFSSDGDTLASASLDGSVSLWNVADGRSPRRLSKILVGPNNFLFSTFVVAFSPDEKILAATAADGSVSLWNIANPIRPHKIGVPLVGDSTGLALLAFSPDGNTLAADTEHETVILWDMTNLNHVVQRPLEKACERAGRGFNTVEWSRYVGTSFQQTCPD